MVGMTKHCAKKDGGELLWRGQDREGGREGGRADNAEWNEGNGESVVPMVGAIANMK
jgi:hypothetical protein